MISDASKWVNIEISFSASGDVTSISYGYRLNEGRIKANTTLVGNQITNKYGVIFYIDGLIGQQENYCELVFYDASGSMLNASRSYFNIVENGKTWIEIDVPHQTSRIEYTFGGNFDVTGIQLYGVNSTATIKVATYEATGVVKPVQEKGIYVEADGRIGVNASKVIDNTLQTTSKNITGAINELFQSATAFADALKLFRTSILSKGGVVAALTIQGINDGILSIPSSGGGGSGTYWFYEYNYDGSNTFYSSSADVYINDVSGRGNYGVRITGSTSKINGYTFAGDHTVIIKLKLLSTTNGSFLSFGVTNITGYPRFILQLYNGKLRYYTNGAYRTTEISLNTIDEYTIVLRSDATILFNGNPLTITNRPLDDTGNLYFGIGYSTPCNIELSSVEIYNRIVDV